jgi:hypothetical protein
MDLVDWLVGQIITDENQFNYLADQQIYYSAKSVTI